LLLLERISDHDDNINNKHTKNEEQINIKMDVIYGFYRRNGSAAAAASG
jgi:hypothetical protein